MIYSLSGFSDFIATLCDPNYISQSAVNKNKKVSCYLRNAICLRIIFKTVGTTRKIIQRVRRRKSGDVWSQLSGAQVRSSSPSQRLPDGDVTRPTSHRLIQGSGQLWLAWSALTLSSSDYDSSCSWGNHWSPTLCSQGPGWVKFSLPMPPPHTPPTLSVHLWCRPIQSERPFSPAIMIGSGMSTWLNPSWAWDFSWKDQGEKHLPRPP